MCRPEIIDREENFNKPYLELREMRHPCIANTGVNFIPNDTVIGRLSENAKEAEEPAQNILLVTGPNMGGKSTILRQTCIAVIMAQVG